MTIVQRFLTSFRETAETIEEPGLIQKEDGTVWIVSPDGTQAQAGTAVAQPPNWCLVQTAIPDDPLTVAADRVIGVGLEIIEQAGTDFSVGTDPRLGKPAINSEAGGLFQIGAYIGNPFDSTLDGGSSTQRYLGFFAISGLITGVAGALNLLGIDILVPILTSGANVNQGPSTVAGVPGLVLPGGPALYSVGALLINGFGADSVPLDNVFGWPMLAVWQIS